MNQRTLMLLGVAALAQPAHAALDGLGNGSQGYLQLLLLGLAAIIPIGLITSFVIAALRKRSRDHSPESGGSQRIARLYFWLIALLLTVPCLSLSLLVYPALQPFIWKIEARPPFHPWLVGTTWFMALLTATTSLALWARSSSFQSPRQIFLFIFGAASTATFAYLSRGLLWGLLYLGPTIYAFCSLRARRGA